MKILQLLIVAFLFNSCIQISNQFSKIPPGPWRAVLKLDNEVLPLAQDAKEVEYKKSFDYEGELPFQFEVVYSEDNNFYINLINGSEKIRVDDIQFGRDPKTGKDTLVIDFPVYDTYIKALYQEGVMEGNWHVNYKDGYAIPFKAEHGKGHRFRDFGKKATANLDGNWKVTFEAETEDAYPAVGEFKQSAGANKITGSFLTETGDYRFLDGSVVGDKLFLSCFDGAHAFLFEGKQLGDGSLQGTFRSGKHYTSQWVATKSDKVELPSPFDLTTTVNSKQLSFAFDNTDGKKVSLEDERYQGKSKLVMIMGTWCPNCRDEMNFLLDYLKKNSPSDLEVIAVGFERYRDAEKSRAVLARYKEKMNIPFEVLHGGYASKKEASEKFPMLNKIISYPTLLFVNKDNEIVKIHTGFNGPATSKFDGFVKEFDHIMSELLK